MQRSFRFAVVSVFLVFLFPSCSCEHVQPPSAVSSPDSTNTAFLPPSTPLSVEYADRIKTAATLQVDAVGNVLDLLTHYFPGASLSSEEEIADLMDSVDPSTMTRDTAEGETISLKEEIERIVRQFTKDFTANLPDYAPALSLPYVREMGTNLLVIGSDQLLPVNSPRGLVETLLLNARAQGKDPREMIAEAEGDLQAFFEGKGSDDPSLPSGRRRRSKRSLYKVSTWQWPGAIVYYRWGHVVVSTLMRIEWLSSLFDLRNPTASDENPEKGLTISHRRALEIAMDDWTNRTGIRFQELPDTFWNNVSLALFLKARVGFQSADRDNKYTLGKATVGYYPGFISVLTLFRGSFRKEKETLLGTARHELGHVIGLSHEHQRYDRDEYVSVSNDGDANYELTPLYKQGIGLTMEFVHPPEGRVNWWFPFPRFTLTGPGRARVSYVVGEFDFQSVMLYDGFPVSQKKIDAKGIDTSLLTPKKGRYFTKENNAISDQDARTAAAMYGLSFPIAPVSSQLPPPSAGPRRPDGITKEITRQKYWYGIWKNFWFYQGWDRQTTRLFEMEREVPRDQTSLSLHMSHDQMYDEVRPEIYVDDLGWPSVNTDFLWTERYFFLSPGAEIIKIAFPPGLSKAEKASLKEKLKFLLPSKEEERPGISGGVKGRWIGYVYADKKKGSFYSPPSYVVWRDTAFENKAFQLIIKLHDGTEKTYTIRNYFYEQ